MAADGRSVPMRTCAGCGAKAPQSELLRLALDQGLVRPDPKRRLPGRGAYICRRGQCAELMRRGRGKRRPFKVSMSEAAWAGFLESPEIRSLPACVEEPRRG